jgi:hypothetical protein
VRESVKEDLRPLLFSKIANAVVNELTNDNRPRSLPANHQIANNPDQVRRRSRDDGQRERCGHQQPDRGERAIVMSPPRLRETRKAAPCAWPGIIVSLPSVWRWTPRETSEPRARHPRRGDPPGKLTTFHFAVPRASPLVYLPLDAGAPHQV